MLDIARDPRWGRIAEGNGEDPFLGAQMGKAVVKGFQGDDYSVPNKIVACAKHYVGYGSAEGGRDYDAGEISEPTLRDVYLPPFESAVKSGVGTVMSAFLDLNGIPASGNRRLLTDVLRGGWDFDGFVVSDWNSVLELVDHGVAEDRAQAAAIALHAGVDMDMVSNAYLETLADNMKAGEVTQAEIDEAVRRILRIKLRAGLFDTPFTDPARAARDLLRPKSRELARQFARESMVLLKNNDGLLPLESNFKRIAVVGPLIHARSELFGCWSPDGREVDVTPLDEALKEIAPKDVELVFADHADKAVHIAHNMDAIVLVVGEYPYRSGENSNVSDLSLPPGQAELVEGGDGLGQAGCAGGHCWSPIGDHQTSSGSGGGALRLAAWHRGWCRTRRNLIRPRLSLGKIAGHLPACHRTSPDLLQSKELWSPCPRRWIFQIALCGFAQRAALSFWPWIDLHLL